MGGTTINFNDTSEYMYRNSSIKKGGFRGNIGLTNTTTLLNVDGTEDVLRTQEQLIQADLDRLRANIVSLDDFAVARLATNANTLESRANDAWDRAVGLFPEMRALLDGEIDAIKTDTLQRIRLSEYQWRRIAGSSLNCTVAALDTMAQVELATKLGGVVAKALQDYKVHESEAIAQAFSMNMQSRLEPIKVAFSHVGTLYAILRGARLTDTTDREYGEGRSENTTVIDGRGEFYHEATAIADNSGTYEGDVDAAYAASQTVAGGIS